MVRRAAAILCLAAVCILSCAYCGKDEADDNAAGSPAGVTIDAWELQESAEDDGSSAAGTSESETTAVPTEETEEGTTPATEHVHAYTSEVIAPSCTSAGYTLHRCACGAEYTDSYTKAAGHSYHLASSTPAGCTSYGTSVYRCTACGDEYTVTDPPAGHSYHVLKKSAATCTSPGSTTYRCSACGDEYTGDYTATLSADGKHHFVTTVSPDGSITRKCTVCGCTG